MRIATNEDLSGNARPLPIALGITFSRWVRAPTRVVTYHGYGGPLPPGCRCVSREGRGTDFVEAGLRNVTVDTKHEEAIELRSGQDLWNWCLGSNPIPNMLVSDLTDDKKASVRAHIDERIRARANGAGVAVLTAPLNIGIGTK